MTRPDFALRTLAGTDAVVLVAGADEPVESYRRFAADVFPLLGRTSR